MAVKVGGMCWVMRTGAWSMTAPMTPSIALSACGPPVDEPIRSTRGVVIGNGRSWIFAGSGALGTMPGAPGWALDGASPGTEGGGRRDRRGRRTRAALAARAERADLVDQLAAERGEVVNSRLVSGLGM